MFRRRSRDKEETRYVFAIIDPRTDMPVAVSHSKDPALAMHVHHKKRGVTETKDVEFYCWMRELLKEGLEPTYRILEEVPPGGRSRRVWRKWIAALASKGVKLLRFRVARRKLSEYGLMWHWRRKEWVNGAVRSVYSGVFVDEEKQKARFKELAKREKERKRKKKRRSKKNRKRRALVTKYGNIAYYYKRCGGKRLNNIERLRAWRRRERRYWYQHAKRRALGDPNFKTDNRKKRLKRRERRLHKYGAWLRGQAGYRGKLILKITGLITPGGKLGRRDQ